MTIGVTEDEARALACPLLALTQHTTFWRALDPDETLTGCCGGARCMAWRWVKGEERRGYCGLAGRP